MGGPLELLVLIATLHGVGCGLQAGPGYRLHDRLCSRHSDCRQDLGEICWWLYDGCDQGQCMCRPGSHTPDKNGLCVPVKLGNEACHVGDRCPEGMACVNETCQCVQGTMHSSDRCILPSERLLGQACNPSTDKCFHMAFYGYSIRGVECTDAGVCECEKVGYKREADTCRKLYIGEMGCSEAFHCEGGAVCLDGYCQCPNGYRAVAEKTKCAKIGALNELPVNRRCDEVNEKAYCARGLKCHRCDSRINTYTCVRYHFYNFESETKALSSSGLLVMPYLPVISVLLIVTSLLTYIHNR